MASNLPGESIKTFALGSCVAVVVYDPVSQTAGMVHVVLPDSRINKARAEALPGYFADTGIHALMSDMSRLVGHLDPKMLIVKLAGGANILRAQKAFNIGQRNIAAVRTELARRGVMPVAHDVGGYVSRNMTIDVENGKVECSSPGRGAWKL